MSVDFDIMQDIPAEKRGLNHWAAPAWLSIRNRQTTYARNYLGNQARPKPSKFKGKGNNGGKRPITIKHPDGRIVRYDSRGEAGLDLGYAKGHPSAPMIASIKRGKKLKDGNIQFSNRRGIYVHIVGA